MQQARSEPRTAQELAVRVFGLDDKGNPVNQPAWTVDISRHGARLRGVPFWHNPGDTIGVRSGTDKARFKIVWVGKAGTSQEGQIGLLCVETGKFIWNMAAASDERKASVTSGRSWTSQGEERPPIALSHVFSGIRNRRYEPRYLVNGGAKVQQEGSKVTQWTTLHDISLGGCYVETAAPYTQGTRIEMTVHVGETQIAARGEVTASHHLEGMGVRFTEVSPLNRQRLEALINGLKGSSTEA
jgi:hypothetical protein